MSETPDMVYGRLLESVHMHGYTNERACQELEWLLDEDRWKKVGPGYEDIHAFCNTLDESKTAAKSGLNWDQKKRLAKKLAALKAKQEAAAKALGVSQQVVSKWTGIHREDTTRGKTAPHADTQEAPDQQQPDSTDSENTTRGTPPPESFQRPAEEVAKHAVKAARKDKAAAQTKAKREASRAADPLPDAMELHLGDAREMLADIAPESAALILTDPPYGDEAQPLYEWLAEWAAKTLIPGGSLICYTGQSRLNRDIRILDQHLRYWWTLAMMHDQSQRLPGKFVIAGYKPVLWYVKDNRRGRSLVPDVLKPPARDKDLHNWAQGEGGVSALIEHLTEPRETILDPFAGTATWGRIATSMGRRWVGATLAEDDGDGLIQT